MPTRLLGSLFGGLGAAREPLIWLCLVVGVNQLGWGIVSPAMPLYANSFGVSEFAVGLTISIYGLGRLMLALPSGQLADRWGRRSILLAGTIVTALGSFLCGASQNFEQLLIFRLIAGAGAGMLVTGSQVILTDISTPANRGRVLSLYQGWFIFAIGLGPAPGGLLAEWFGYRAPFYTFAGLALVAGVVAYLRVPETHRSRVAPATGAPGATDPATPPSRPYSFWQVMTIPGIALAGIVMFAQSFSRTGAIFAVVPLFGEKQLGLTPSQIGWTFSIANFLMMASVALTGPLADRYSRKTLIVPSTLLTAGSFVIFAFAGNFPVYLLAGALWGLTGGLGSTAPTAYVGDRSPRNAVGLAMGAYRSLGELGYLIGAALLGWIADHSGSSTALIATAGLFVGVGLIFWIWAPESRDHRPAPGRVAPESARASPRL